MEFLSRVGVFAFALASVAAPASAAETVLLLAHSPDGIPMGAVLESVAAELREAGLAPLAPAEAATRLSGSRESLDDVRRAIADAERAYLDLDLDRANTILQNAVVRLDAAPGPRATELLVLALSRHALVLSTRAKTVEATATLDRLYRLDLGHRPDPTYVSPRFAPAFEDAAKRARAAEARQVRVTSAPEGAEIYVDGRSIGPAPMSIPLVDGAHRFEARLTGHRTIVESRETAGGDVPLRLDALADDASRDAAAREALESGVLPARREKFALELSGRLAAGSAVVVTARRGMPLAVDLYRANQPAASLDRVDAAVGASAGTTISAWVERRLRPPVAAVAPARPMPVKATTPRTPQWRWIAAGAAVLALGAGAAYASADTEGDPNTRVENRKNVRFGGTE